MSDPQFFDYATPPSRPPRRTRRRLAAARLLLNVPVREVRVEMERPLRRVLSFTQLSIDDVVNDPIAKRKVLGYYKLHKAVNRSFEQLALERQWNPLGLR